MSENCPTCGDEFPSTHRMKLHHAHAHDEKIQNTATCVNCESVFTHQHPNGANKYCGRACFREDTGVKVDVDRSKYQSDDVEELLRTLYVDEGRSQRETYRAQCVILGYENRLYLEEVAEKLRDMGVTRQRTWKDLVESDPEDLGLSSNPAGDESYKNYYGQQAD